MMKLTLYLLIVGIALAPVGAEAASSSSEWTNVADADLYLMGDYEGSWVNPPENSYQYINPHLMAQVINVDVGRYRFNFVQDLDARAEPYFQGEGRVEGDAIVVDERGWKLRVARDGMAGTARIGNQDIQFTLKRVVRNSPTLGAAAPEGAIVLFDGSNFDEWEHDDGRAVTWNLIGDEAMEIEPGAAHKGADPLVGGSIRTKRVFRDARYHMEFRYPVEPGKSGQGRGNSGLFFQGTYEAQILNSYGLEGYWNELGALYKLSPPQVNAARPPMQWQTYDVIYHAPRFENGKLARNARMTVLLNGVRVQLETELVHQTAHRQADRDNPPPSEPGPIMLQDHSNRIQFRNIWVKEL